MTYHNINSDNGHTRSKQQLDKTLKTTLTSPSKNNAEMEKHKHIKAQTKKKQNGNCKAF